MTTLIILHFVYIDIIKLIYCDTSVFIIYIFDFFFLPYYNDLHDKLLIWWYIRLSLILMKDNDDVINIILLIYIYWMLSMIFWHKINKYNDITTLDESCPFILSFFINVMLKIWIPIFSFEYFIMLFENYDIYHYLVEWNKYNK